MTVVERAVYRLHTAETTRTPCPPLRDLIDAADTTTAYAVQRRLTADRLAAGAQVVGRKIGLTSPAVQRQLRVDQPDFGVLFDDMGFHSGDTIPTGRLLQPKVEAEIAFFLAEDLVDGAFDIDRMRQAVAYAAPALEVVDSRIANWDITFADTVADNASSGLYVLGRTRRTLGDFEPVQATMSMTVDGDVASTGSGSDCLGDPLNALAWLARTASAFGDPLRAGQLVLSGALGPMVAVSPGSAVSADIEGLGSVAVTFAAHGS
jgi:2-keto-4-pentenoate hydratase